MNEFKPGRFHHTSFLRGGPTRCAGQMQVSKGTIQWVSNETGHYKTPPERLLAFLNHYRIQIPDHTPVKVVTKGGEVETTCGEFRRAPDVVLGKSSPAQPRSLTDDRFAAFGGRVGSMTN
ncbi:MAG: hypothetical protein JO069_20505 [Verrucomicrobia bacterium]|nr:hypothetical protein [Verrucomicrobiota bacterium]